MTRSAGKIALFLSLGLLGGGVWAASPPDAEMAAAATAIASAQRALPRGPAADALASAQDSFSQAQALVSRKKYRDALRLAEESRATADLALARARLVNAQIEVDEKAARNADLRRQLLVLPGSSL